MQTSTNLVGSQVPTPNDSATLWKNERRANFPETVRAVRRRTRLPSSPSSIRRPSGYADSETHDTPQWIPSSVSAVDGRNDRVHLVCEIATVICETKDDADNFVFRCGAAPKDQRDEHQLFSKWFTTAPLNGKGWGLKIRSSAMSCGEEIFEAPLPDGKLKLSRVDAEDGKQHILIKADLHVNVNRALNHRRKELAEQSPDAIFKNPAVAKRGLCGNDNLAPFDLENGEHDRARETLLTMTIEAIRAEVQQAAIAANDSGNGETIVLDHPGRFSLWEVETCWDFGGAGFAALDAMDNIRPGFREYGGKKGWEANTGTMTSQFSKAESLTAYAKNFDRLRFEIRHRPNEGNRRYSFQTIAEVLAELESLRQSAAERVNGLLSFIAGRPSASRSGREWEDYAMRWGACCDVSEAAQTLFAILRQHGRIYGGRSVECIPNGDVLLRRARDAGLLHNSHGAYRPLFPNASGESLTDFDNTALLVGHVSETQTVTSGFVNGSFSAVQNLLEGVPPSPPACFIFPPSWWRSSGVARRF